MVYGVAHLISSYLSQFFKPCIRATSISTGTSPGVGMGHEPQQYLQTCDVPVELGIEGLWRAASRMWVADI